MFLLLVVLCAYEAFGQLPEPSGPHCIGKTKMQVIDGSRLEEFTEAPGDYRRLVLDIWYPGLCEGETGPYIHPEVLDAYKQRAKMGNDVDLSFISSTKTHAYQDSKIESAVTSAPSVVFSHGAGTPMDLYASIYEDLASHGYLVFVISHTFEAAAVEFPGGEIVPRNEEYTKRQFTDAVVKEWNDLLAFVGSDASSGEKLAKVKQVFSSGFPGTGNVKRRVDDISCVLDKIAELNRAEGSPFRGRLNLKQVGGLGHSFGGAAMGQAVLSEKRIRAAVNLDGWQFGEVVGRELTKPLLYVRRDGEQPDALNAVIYARSGSKFAQVKVKGALHESFSDLPFFARSNDYFKVGPLAAGRGATIVNELILGFFDHHLRGSGKAWESVVSKYPELVLESSE